MLGTREEEEGCCDKADMKKEAQRTNRFNTNYSFHDSAASSNSTPRSHLESTSSRVGSDDYKMQDKDDVPCINIILKPIFESKTEQNDKDVQIVEVTAVTENINKHSTANRNTSFTDQPQPPSKETAKVETRCVDVQTEDMKSVRDDYAQTTEVPINERDPKVSTAQSEIPETPVGNVSVNRRVADADIKKKNRGVQFGNDSLNQNSEYLPANDLSRGINVDNSNTTRNGGAKDKKTLSSPVGNLDSTVTLCKLVHGELDEYGQISPRDNESGRGKLSDRIKRDIDKLEIENISISTQSSLHDRNSSCGTWQGCTATLTKLLTCNDICKDIASQGKSFETHPDGVNHSRATQNVSTLPSVLSNNPSIPKISLNTTESTDLKHSSKNKSEMQKSRNWYGNDKTTNTEINNAETTISPVSPRRFWNHEISSLGIDKNSESKSTYTSNEGRRLELINNASSPMDNKSVRKPATNFNKPCISIATQTNSLGLSKPPECSSSARPESQLANSKTGNTLTTSDLTRPEFIRMLTEIKEHTCSLELHLSAMNEALKRKQVTRSRGFHSTPKNDEPSKHDQIDYGTQANKMRIKNQPLFSTDELSSIEYTKLSPKVFNGKISAACDNSLAENETRIDETCCGVIPEAEESVSLLRNGPKKPTFETKRSYLRTPHRKSDYQMWQQKAHRLSRSSSPNSLVSKSKTDVACSPTNCSEVAETSLQIVSKTERSSPIHKSEKSDATLKSTRSTASNPSIYRGIARPAVITSTPKNFVKTSPRNKHKATPESQSNKDGEDSQLNLKREYKATSTTTETPCEVNSLEYSNNENKCCESTKSELISEATNQNQEPIVPTSSIRLKGPHVRPKLGFKRSSLKARSKDRPKSIISKDSSHSSKSRESLSKTGSTNSSIRYNAYGTSPVQFKRVGAIPRLKLMSSRSKHPPPNYVENDSSGANVDPVCCGIGNAKTLVSETTLVDRNRGKDYFAYSIETEQNTPFSENQSNKFDSEEEMKSTDYGIGNSGQKSLGKQTKDHVNDKKRKLNSECKNLATKNNDAGFSDSNDSEVRKWQKNPKLSQREREHGCDFVSREISDYSGSGTVGALAHVLKKSEQSNSHFRDSKCTISVTVSLDDTPSKEEVKMI